MHNVLKMNNNKMVDFRLGFSSETVVISLVTTIWIIFLNVDAWTNLRQTYNKSSLLRT